MSKKQHPALEYLVYLSAAVLVSIVGIFTPQFAFTTTDDTANLSHYLTKYNEQSGASVLGANDKESSNDCPLDKPIVGWLSYTGDKLLPSKIPAGEEPTVCFESYQKAYSEGFVDAGF